MILNQILLDIYIYNLFLKKKQRVISSLTQILSQTAVQGSIMEPFAFQ